MLLNNDLKIILQVNHQNKGRKDNRYLINLDQTTVKLDSDSKNKLPSPCSLQDILLEHGLWDKYNDIRQIVETATQGKGWIIYPKHIKTLVAVYTNTFPDDFSVYPKRVKGVLVYPEYPNFEIDLIQEYGLFKDNYTK